MEGLTAVLVGIVVCLGAIAAFLLLARRASLGEGDHGPEPVDVADSHDLAKLVEKPAE